MPPRIGGLDRPEPIGLRGRPAAMRRLPALLAIAAVLVGCGWQPSSRPEAQASTTAPSSAARTLPPPATPAPTQEPFPLLSVETRGGECAEGACHRLINLEADGTLREVIPKTRVVGTVPKGLLDALQVEMDQANFLLIESRPFTGECPVAFDGQETIYTFHLLSGDEEIASCKVAIDENHPLFRAVAAVMALVES